MTAMAAQGDDVARVRRVIEKNRRAMAIAVVAGFVLANLIFWGIGFGLPDLEITAPIALGAIGAGLVLAVGLRLLLGSRESAFDAIGPSTERGATAEDEKAWREEQARAGAAGSVRESLGPADPSVAGDLAAMRKATLRNVLAAFAAAVVGVIVAVVASELIAAFGRFIEDDLATIDMFGSIALGFLAAFALFARLRSPVAAEADEPVPVRPSDRDWFAETLATTGRLEIRQAVDLAGAYLGLYGPRRYELLDGGGAQLATVREQGSFVSRLVPDRFRALELEVVDVDRRVLLLRRPVSLLGGRCEVLDAATDERIGTLHRSPIPWLRSYRLETTTVPALEIQGALWPRRLFRIERDGVAVGELRKHRRGWFAARHEPDRFALELPRESTAAERRLLLAAALWIDVVHY